MMLLPASSQRNLWEYLRGMAPVWKDPFWKKYFKAHATCAWDVFRRNGVASSPPINLCLVPTRMCNLRCSMCQQFGENGYLRDRELFREAKTVLPPEDWMRLLDEVAPSRPSINFFGGEPLMYPHIGKLFEHTAKKKLPWLITSNGTLLEQYAESIVANNCWLVWVSIDGIPETHNRIRGSDTAFERSERGLRAVQRERKKRNKALPLILINSVISGHNQKEMIALADLSRELGVDVLRYSTAWRITRPMGEKYERVLRDEFGAKGITWKPYECENFNLDLEVLVKDLDYALKRPDPFSKFIALGFKTRDFKRFYLEPEKPLRYKRCYAPYFQADILADGSVIYCHDYTDLRFGNFTKEPFLKIWNNEKSRQFRRFLLEDDLGVCLRCCGMFAHPFNRSI